MPILSRSELFWNAPHRFSSTRAVDPLGFDALREAMSNVLVPFLTGSTTHAEHYIGIISGLRWAKELALPPVDEQIWSHFSRYERGLKQYWHRHPSGRPARNRYLGKRRIAEICSGPSPDVHASILVDQRGVGMLGNYIESLRAIGLVQRSTLSAYEPAVVRLLGDPQFEWDGRSPGTWQRLDSVFERVDQRGAWRRLGRLLFDCDMGGEDRFRMYAAARTLKFSRPGDAWIQFATRKTLLEPQRQVAAATQSATQLEDGLRELFGAMLQGQEPTVSPSARNRLARLARKIISNNIIATIWPNEPPVAQVLEMQLDVTAHAQMSAAAVLQWHHEIMRVRATEPWLHAPGERSMLMLSAARGEPDFRLTNLQTLLRETKWVA
jgi:hypothetical protein